MFRRTSPKRQRGIYAKVTRTIGRFAFTQSRLQSETAEIEVEHLGDALQPLNARDEVIAVEDEVQQAELVIVLNRQVEPQILDVPTLW